MRTVRIGIKTLFLINVANGKCELLQLMMRTDLYGVSVMDANDVKSVNNYTLV